MRSYAIADYESNAADTAGAFRTERLFLASAIRRSIEDLKREAQTEGCSPMAADVEEFLVRIGGVASDATVTMWTRAEGLRESPPILPAYFLDDDVVNVVFHNSVTARRISVDVPWSTPDTVRVYIHEAKGMRKVDLGSDELTDLLYDALLWLTNF